MTSQTIKKTRFLIGERFKEARLEAGLTQQVVGDRAGVDRKTINRIENGIFSPSVDTLLRVCYVFDVEPSKMLKGVAL